MVRHALFYPWNFNLIFDQFIENCRKISNFFYILFNYYAKICVD